MLAAIDLGVVRSPDHPDYEPHTSTMTGLLLASLGVVMVAGCWLAYRWGGVALGHTYHPGQLVWYSYNRRVYVVAGVDTTGMVRISELTQDFSTSVLPISLQPLPGVGTFVYYNGERCEIIAQRADQTTLKGCDSFRQVMVPTNELSPAMTSPEHAEPRRGGGVFSDDDDDDSSSGSTSGDSTDPSCSEGEEEEVGSTEGEEDDDEEMEFGCH